MSHTKRSFVQAVIISAKPALDRVHAGIDYAEKVWDELTRRGYGAPQADKAPRDRVDWFARLNPEQQTAFERFWKAYDCKKGRNDAAMVWGQLSLDADELPWILASARAESQQWRNAPPQGQTSIYPQGWLSGYRWRDHPRPGAGDEAHKGPAGSVQKSARMGELAGLRRLYEHAPNEALARQIAELENAIVQGQGR